ncbi:MAG: hypothetical protein JXR40_08045 [Pontiellaceae bacterium]|nr:hypothetical protein [Pontiellaceae bacterium]
MTKLPTSPYVPLDRITDRLPLIFPEGSAQRSYLIREIAAKTIFVMLYIDAIKGKENWIRPSQVTRMTDEQAGKTDKQSRESWKTRSLISSTGAIPGRWYADNTREPIRDETLRAGLIETGAVIEREGLPTTSSKPRYALQKNFAGLFFANETDFPKQLKSWQESHLSAGALARLKLVRQGIGKSSASEHVQINFPNGTTRMMSHGPSSEITKAFIEEFAPRFLENPGVIFVSESGNKVLLSDNVLAKSVGINIDAQKVLPDLIMIDLAPKTPLVVFVEVFATDGPISPKRKNDLLEIFKSTGFNDDDVTFVTAFLDKSAQGTFRKLSDTIAWDSFVWFASEPDQLISYQSYVDNKCYLHQICKKP